MGSGVGRCNTASKGDAMMELASSKGDATTLACTAQVVGRQNPCPPSGCDRWRTWAGSVMVTLVPFDSIARSPTTSDVRRSASNVEPWTEGEKKTPPREKKGPAVCVTIK